MNYTANSILKKKIETSIERYKAFEPEDGYYLAFSGGKDSVVIKALADMAGVKYDAHYRIATVDPPELVQFIKEKHPDVSRDYPRYSDGQIVTMWNLIPRKLMPPTRLVRYCCKFLKEDGGDSRFTVTGVRWAESYSRQENQGIVLLKDAGKRKTKNEFYNNSNFRSTDKGGWCLSMTTRTAEEWWKAVSGGTRLRSTL